MAGLPPCSQIGYSYKGRVGDLEDIYVLRLRADSRRGVPNSVYSGCSKPNPDLGERTSEVGICYGESSRSTCTILALNHL